MGTFCPTPHPPPPTKPPGPLESAWVGRRAHSSNGSTWQFFTPTVGWQLRSVHIWWQRCIFLSSEMGFSPIGVAPISDDKKKWIAWSPMRPGPLRMALLCNSRKYLINLQVVELEPYNLFVFFDIFFCIFDKMSNRLRWTNQSHHDQNGCPLNTE